MIEDKLFQYWTEHLSEDFMKALKKSLASLARDTEHRKSTDPYNIGNILLALEFTEMTSCVSYLFQKYGAEFVDYLQGMLILEK